ERAAVRAGLHGGPRAGIPGPVLPEKPARGGQGNDGRPRGVGDRERWAEAGAGRATCGADAAPGRGGPSPGPGVHGEAGGEEARGPAGSKGRDGARGREGCWRRGRGESRGRKAGETREKRGGAAENPGRKLRAAHGP